MSIPNGHTTPLGKDRPNPAVQPPRSESDLSDVNDLPTTNISSITEGREDVHSDDDAIHDMATSESEHDEDADGEEDADFEMETPPPAQAEGMRHDRSLSEESLRPGKRKASIDDDVYMKQNPELYGLRRSVRSVPPALAFTSLTRCCQGRARPSRRVVRTDPTHNT